MATQPFVVLDEHRLPDYLPARMVNEFVYCPRLFFYEWVEGVFLESADTLEGKQQHKRVDRSGKSLPEPEEIEEDLQTRSVMLSSETHRVIAKLDLLDVENGAVTPVDYKHGRPRESGDGLESCGSPTASNLLCRRSCYARTGTAATRRWSTTFRQNSE